MLLFSYRNRPFIDEEIPKKKISFSLFFLKEIPLPMETVPKSRTGPVSSLSTHGIPRSSLVILNILLLLLRHFLLLLLLASSLFPRFYYGGWCIVLTLRCVYALSTLIMNASVSSTARVLTRRAQVHGRSTLYTRFF